MPLEFIEYEAPYLDRLVGLWRQAFEFGVGVTDPHPLAEQREYFVSKVLPTNQVTLALFESQLVGFVAASAESVAQLHVQVCTGKALAQTCWRCPKPGLQVVFGCMLTRNTRRASSTRRTLVLERGFELDWQLEDVKYTGRQRQAALSELGCDLLTLTGRTIWATRSRRRTIIAFIALCGNSRSGRGAANGQDRR
jgi:hypothetical protein